MPLPRRCEKCKEIFTPEPGITRYICRKCKKEIEILNGKCRNETFKKMFELKNINRRI